MTERYITRITRREHLRRRRASREIGKLNVTGSSRTLVIGHDSNQVWTFCGVKGFTVPEFTPVRSRGPIDLTSWTRGQDYPTRDYIPCASSQLLRREFCLVAEVIDHAYHAHSCVYFGYNIRVSNICVRKLKQEPRAKLKSRELSRQIERDYLIKQNFGGGVSPRHIDSVNFITPTWILHFNLNAINFNYQYIEIKFRNKIIEANSFRRKKNAYSEISLRAVIRFALLTLAMRTLCVYALVLIFHLCMCIRVCVYVCIYADT